MIFSERLQEQCPERTLEHTSSWLVGVFKYFIFGEDFHFDEHLFQMRWFNMLVQPPTSQILPVRLLKGILSFGGEP